MTTEFDVATSETGKIICFLTGDKLEPKPEEWVRQKYLRVLHYEYRYPKNVMRREVPVIYGSKEMQDRAGNPVIPSS